MATNTLNDSQPSAEQVLTAVYQVLRNDPETLAKVQAALEPKSEEPTCSKDDGPIWLKITPTVQRNYERRGVFPQFRPSRAAKILPNGAIVFYVTVEQAEEIVKDAQEQRWRSDAPRGEAIAFGSLSKGLPQEIYGEKFRDCIEFPGAEKIDAERRAASSLLKVGQLVDVWVDDKKRAGRAAIIEEYGPMIVDSVNGEYVKKDKKVRYCNGYVVVHDDGQKFFYYAHQLAPVGERYGHLRLVR